MDRRAFLAAGVATVLGSHLGRGDARSDRRRDGFGSSGTRTLDARGTADDYGPLGKVTVGGAKEAVVSADGTTAFLAVTDGFAVVDLSDPAAPTIRNETRDVLADHERGPLRRVWDVTYDDDRLVVASQGGANGPLYAFVVYDVSDPANPKRLLWREARGPIHNCDLADGHVYLTGLHANHHSEEEATAARLPVEVYDVRGEESRKVADWSPLDEDQGWADVPARNRVIHDVSVVSGRAYLAYWDAGAVLLDVSDPAEPAFLSRVGEFTPGDLAAMSAAELDAEATEGPAGNAHYVTGSADGSLLAVGKEAWDDPATGGGGPGGIDLYDASDPTDPRKVATIEPEPAPDETYGGVWTTAHNFEIRGDRLYSAWYRAGVKVHDVSDPASPERLAWWLAPREASFWTAQVAVPGEFFVASSAAGGRSRLPESEEALFAFPDRAGEQADRPSFSSVLTPTPTATSTGDHSTVTGKGGSPGRSTPPSGSANGTARPPATATNGTGPATPTRDTGENKGTSRTRGQSGFGALAALGGIAIGAYRALSEE
jgi:hypothetical protein